MAADSMAPWVAMLSAAKVQFKFNSNLLLYQRPPTDKVGMLWQRTATHNSIREHTTKFTYKTHSKACDSGIDLRSLNGFMSFSAFLWHAGNSTGSAQDISWFEFEITNLRLQPYVLRVNELTIEWKVLVRINPAIYEQHRRSPSEILTTVTAVVKS